MPEDKVYHPTEHHDLKYKNQAIFEAGRQGYRDNLNNPYPKYLRDHRADWFMGFLYEQRLVQRARPKGPSL